MGDEWEALFGADIDDEEKDVNDIPEDDEEDIKATPDRHSDPYDDDDSDDGKDKAKKKLFAGKSEKKDEPVKPQKKEKAPKEKTVHGLKRKETKEADPYSRRGNGHGVVIAAGIGAVAVIAAIGAGGFVANKRVQAVNETNENLTQQIASRTRNVYTAKRDLKAGDEIITSGASANVELSQVYTSLSDSAYISEDTTGYAQVDIKAGLPVMAGDVDDTNPIEELNNAIDEATSVYKVAKEMPYRITADYVDLENDNKALAEPRDLVLDEGSNEKAFNTEAEAIDGYVLKSIQVDGEGTHAYGVSEKSMKEGVVSMYYYTTKGGWGRHEIKGNIRVTYGYVKQDDPSEEIVTDVFDDSAWIDMPEEESAESAEAVTVVDEDADAAADAQDAVTDGPDTESTADDATAEDSTETSEDDGIAEETDEETEDSDADTEE